MPVLDKFHMVSQGAAGNLCWACVGWSVATYYDGRAGVSPRWNKLCEYVMKVADTIDETPPESTRCCDGERLLDPDCNQPRFLPDAFRVSKNRGSTHERVLTFQEIKTEIDAGRPIGAEINSSSAGSHVIAIYGYDDSESQKVMVGDPAPDAPDGALVLYDELCSGYRHTDATWNQSYLTVP
jgi:Peptidase_C39 like family